MNHLARCCRRLSFTLIELLVVIAIMSATAALLLAAVQKAREAANRVSCTGNLRQLALAMHAYQEACGILPPNYHEDVSRTDGSHNLFYGPFVSVPPFLELENAYRNFSFLYYDSSFPNHFNVAQPGGMSWRDHCWQRNPFNRPPLQSYGFVPPPSQLSCPNPTGSTNVPGQTWGAQGSYKLFTCPSQPFDHDQSQGTAVCFFLQGLPTVDMPSGNPFSDPSALTPQCVDTNSTMAGNGCTLSALTYPPGNDVIGRSDYVAVVGLFTDAGFPKLSLTPGLATKYRSLFNHNAHANLAYVPDGTSNTLLLSEYSGYLVTNEVQAQVNGWATASWVANGVSVAFGTCPDPNNSTALGGYCHFDGAGLGGGSTLGGWHAGLFQVAFADGAVRPLRLGLDRSILFALAGSNDGDVVSPADF